MGNTKSSSDKDLKNWWDKIDSRLSKLFIGMLSLLLFTQLIFMNQSIRTFLSGTEKLEGKTVAESQLLIERGEIEFTIENYDSTGHLSFYINGEKEYVKSGKTVRLQVKDNDIVEISGSDLDDMAILRVASVSENMSVPEPGKIIYINGNLVLVDRVRLK